MKASELGDGVWTAQWKKWEFVLDGKDGQWVATISPHRDPDAGLHQAGFASAAEAVKWMAAEMKTRGIVVFVLGVPDHPGVFSLEHALNFERVMS